MKYVYAACGFALGAVLTGLLLWGIGAGVIADAERRLDDSLKRSRVLLADAQSELERERYAHQLTRGSLEKAGRELGIAQARLARSVAELGRLRAIQTADGIAIDGSIQGIERIRAIVEGLPLLE